MKTIGVVLLGMMLAISVGCASPQSKAARAEEKVHKERLQLIEDYKKCLKKAGDDQAKAEKCDSYLKAAEALK